METPPTPAPERPAASFAVEGGRDTNGDRRVRLSGALHFLAVHRGWDRVRAAAEGADGGAGTAEHTVRFDLSGVTSLDGGTAALLVELLADLRRRGRTVRLEGAEEQVRSLLELYGVDDAPRAEPAPARAQGLLEQVGAACDDQLRRLRDVADFTGRFALRSARSLRTPGAVPWRDAVRLVERHGADAVPIVFVINLLVGVILAFQSASQLERFGAEVFVANLVGLSVVRELAPLMTAILVAGRSGAAFAAELGTMRVSEEIDALRTLGISPMVELVVPRFLALAVALPLLTLLADAAGVAGGLAIGVTVLDLTLVGYWNQTLDAIAGWDVGTGLLKSVAFAATVALIACQRGLATRGGAEGVGRSATSAVVSCIFFLVALDAALTWLFSLYAL